ncbi:MAG: phosphoribosylformylglycinamidine cyclo-ligase [Deltaproteobacteria bacterium]|nr:phosphoribosylformylglycinamidine cyclo-ligase [Deltaproteobacteria bacterium]MCB9786113.1 phosphoribosylformylglycinamidine cyclo-ligase [Deltaproteobacteria bacterium]
MGLTYRGAGVDIDAGNELVRRIGPLARATRRAGVISDIGGFGGLFRMADAGYRDPVLVSGTDGVGTKLDVAVAMGVHDTIGVDLVAMCVNDVLTSGAEPLFFLDYFATGRLDPEVGEAVVRGIAEGCRQAGCALLGGETAELPGMYADGVYDLAGFVVGAVERDAILGPDRVAAGDVLLGLPSSGLHSNGYSLARKALLEVAGLGLDDRPAPLTTTLGEALLAPTRIYVRPVLAALRGAPGAIHAMAHITGGGLVENLPRVLPEGLRPHLRHGAWDEPPIYALLRQCDIAEDELRRTFNLGLGLVMAVDSSQVDAVSALLRDAGETPTVVGEVAP